MKRIRARAPRWTLREHRLMQPVLLLILSLATLFAAPAMAGQVGDKTAKVTAFKVAGSKRFSEEELARTAGLEPGTVVTREDIQAGADKLSKIGWFNQVSYRFQTTAKGVEIDFTLVDAPTAPLWFDNFPWFSDAEIAAAMRAAGVLYDGTAPDSGVVLDAMREALAGLLKAHNIPGDVEGEMIQAPASDGMVERFRVSGVELRVNSLEFTDPTASDDPGVKQLLDTIVGKPYSRYNLAIFLSEQVRRLYVTKGYLRVKFAEPVALFAVEPGKPLPNEVSLRVGVEPGVLYHWGGATWSGATAMDAAALDAVLGFKTGDPANGEEIEGAWGRVTAAFGKRGYIEAKVAPTPQYDDAAARVTYAVHVAQGNQFRMGQMILTGLSLDAERKLLANWKLPRGEVFDNSYYEDFVNQGARAIFKDTPVHINRIGRLLRPNPQTKTVDVLLDFQ